MTKKDFELNEDSENHSDIGDEPDQLIGEIVSVTDDTP